MMKKKSVVKRKATKKTVKKPLPKKAVARKAVKKPVKKLLKKTTKKLPAAKPRETVLGVITHYFPHVRAAVVKLKIPLEAGAMIRIKGHTSDFTQKVTSMQIDRVPVMKAKKGDEVGLQVDSRVRRKDTVFKA